MQTECSAEQFEFEGLGRRRVVAAFDGGAVSSDGGALWLRHADRAIGLIDRVAACFVDRRAQDQVVHSLPALVGQPATRAWSLEGELAHAAAEHAETGGPAPRFKEFRYATLESWSRERRVIGKTEHLAKGLNPRFIVTSLAPAAIEGRALYEQVYCARGEMENRIKEQQLDLFADRTSAATMRANQLRLWFASFAYVLLEALRRIGLRHTHCPVGAGLGPRSPTRPGNQDATCGTIRLKLLKLGARVTVSIRRIKVAIASACPYRSEFALAHLRLATWTGPPSARAAA